MILLSFKAFESFRLASVILSIALLIDTFNFFFKKELYYDGNGLFAYNKLILDRRQYLRRVFIAFPFFFKFRYFCFLMAARLIFALILLAGITDHCFMYIALFILQLIFNVRNVYTLSGADQMQTILLFGLLLYSCSFNDSISLLSLYFITIQVLFSYFFSGFHKIKSKKWRNGEALLLVLNSETFGNDKVLFLLYKYKKIAMFFCWVIMLTQLSFIIALIFFPQFAIYYLIILFLFHLSISFLMNLNHFFWTFISSYPIVYFTFQNAWKF